MGMDIQKSIDKLSEIDEEMKNLEGEQGEILAAAKRLMEMLKELIETEVE